MPLPDLNDTAGWAAFIAKRDLTGVTPEEVATDLLESSKMEPPRAAEQRFLNETLRKLITEQASSPLKRCPAHGREEVLEEVMHVLTAGLLTPESSESDGLRTAFAPTVRHRTIDAMRRWYGTHKGTVPLDELAEFADPAAEGEAETGAAFQNAVRRMKPEDAAALQTGITGIEPSIKVAGRTHRRHLASARQIMFNEFETTKFATAFNLDLPAPEAPPPMPAWISTREIYTLAFAYSCPKPTDAEVETWCGYFPTAADDIRECAKFMRLDVAQVLALALADA